MARAGDPDNLDNGLLLCAPHHRAFDRGGLGLHPDLRFEVSRALRGEAPATQALRALDGAPLEPPSTAAALAEAFVRWHDCQVFRARAGQSVAITTSWETDYPGSGSRPPARRLSETLARVAGPVLTDCPPATHDVCDAPQDGRRALLETTPGEMEGGL